MRFCSLGSGSEGNGLLVEFGPVGSNACILIDCGFGIREARRRFERAGRRPEELRAILVTHEHGDHIGGAPRLSASAEVPLWMTRGTARGAPSGVAPTPHWRTLDPDQPFELEGLRIEPFTVPHDAREPVQFVLDDGVTRLGVLTDLGQSTPHVVRALSRLDALVLECNHDRALLDASDYPLSLKRRIGGPYGHLANEASAELLAAIDHSRLRTVVAAHLSRSNNRPELAQEALARAWGCTPEQILVADQDEGLHWQTV